MKRARFTYPVKIALLASMVILAALIVSCSSNAKREYEAIASYNKGVKAIKSENFELAGFYFRRAVIIKPDFKEAELNLANAYFLDGNLDAAREEYVKLLSEHDKDPRLYFNLGWIYLTQDDIKTSRQCFENLNKEFPNFHDADYGLAMLAQKTGDEESEKTYMQKYLDSDPNGRWSENAKQAIAAFDKLNQQNEIPDTDNNNIDDAAEIQPSDNSVTDNTNPDINKIETEKNITPGKKEIKEPPKTKEKAPKTNTKEMDKAKEKTTPPSTALYNGFKALEKHDLKKAEKYFKEAAKKDPKSPDPSFGLAKVYFLSKKSSIAMEEVRKSVKLRGGNQDDSFEIGQELEKIGDLKSAIREYRNYLAGNPFGKNAEKVKERLTILDKSLGGES